MPVMPFKHFWQVTFIQLRLLVGCTQTRVPHFAGIHVQPPETHCLLLSHVWFLPNTYSPCSFLASGVVFNHPFAHA